jgi:hypothetical protein
MDEPGSGDAFEFAGFRLDRAGGCLHRRSRLYAHLGGLREAREIVDRLRAITADIMPGLSLLRKAEDGELWLSGLRLAIGE